jgi:hypothetical protein
MRNEELLSGGVMKVLTFLLLGFMLLIASSPLEAQEEAYFYSGSQAKELSNITKTASMRCIQTNTVLVRELSSSTIQAFFLPGGKVKVGGNEDWYVFFPQKERANAFFVRVQEKEFACLHNFAKGPQGKAFYSAVLMQAAQTQDDGASVNRIAAELFKTVDELQPKSRAREETEQIVGAVIGTETKLIGPDIANRFNQFSSSYKSYALAEAIKQLAQKYPSIGSTQVFTYGGALGAWDLTELSFQSPSRFFKPEEFQDLRDLYATVQKSDRLSALLKGYFSASTLEQLLKYPTQNTASPKLLEDIVKDLNKVLISENLIRQPDFASLPVTRAIKAAGIWDPLTLSGENLVHVNRSLLEEAFPDAIPKDLEGNKPFIVNGVPYVKAWKGSTLVFFRLEQPEFFSPKDLRPEKIHTFLANQPALCSEKPTNSPRCTLTAIP